MAPVQFVTVEAGTRRLAATQRHRGAASSADESAAVGLSASEQSSTPPPLAPLAAGESSATLPRVPLRGAIGEALELAGLASGIAWTKLPESESTRWAAGVAEGPSGAEKPSIDCAASETDDDADELGRHGEPVLAPASLPDPTPALRPNLSPALAPSTTDSLLGHAPDVLGPVAGRSVQTHRAGAGARPRQGQPPVGGLPDRTAGRASLDAWSATSLWAPCFPALIDEARVQDALFSTSLAALARAGQGASVEIDVDCSPHGAAAASAFRSRTSSASLQTTAHRFQGPPNPSPWLPASQATKSCLRLAARCVGDQWRPEALGLYTPFNQLATGTATVEPFALGLDLALVSARATAHCTGGGDAGVRPVPCTAQTRRRAATPASPRTTRPSHASHGEERNCSEYFVSLAFKSAVARPCDSLEVDPRSPTLASVAGHSKDSASECAGAAESKHSATSPGPRAVHSTPGVARAAASVLGDGRRAGGAPHPVATTPSLELAANSDAQRQLQQLSPAPEPMQAPRPSQSPASVHKAPAVAVEPGAQTATAAFYAPTHSDSPAAPIGLRNASRDKPSRGLLAVAAGELDTAACPRVSTGSSGLERQADAAPSNGEDDFVVLTGATSRADPARRTHAMSLEGGRATWAAATCGATEASPSGAAPHGRAATVGRTAVSLDAFSPKQTGSAHPPGAVALYTTATTSIRSPTAQGASMVFGDTPVGSPTPSLNLLERFARASASSLYLSAVRPWSLLGHPMPRVLIVDDELALQDSVASQVKRLAARLNPAWAVLLRANAADHMRRRRWTTRACLPSKNAPAAADGKPATELAMSSPRPVYGGSRRHSGAFASSPASQAGARARSSRSRDDRDARRRARRRPDQGLALEELARSTHELLTTGDVATHPWLARHGGDQLLLDLAESGEAALGAFEAIKSCGASGVEAAMRKTSSHPSLSGSLASPANSKEQADPSGSARGAPKRWRHLATLAPSDGSNADSGSCEPADGPKPPRWEARDYWDLVILDISMPGCGGPATAERLRKAGFTGVILGHTGNSVPEDLQYMCDMGADACELKPMDQTKLEHYLCEAFLRRRAQFASLEE